LFATYILVLVYVYHGLKDLDTGSRLCSLCGRRIARHRLRFSEKFVGFPDMFDGDMVCDVCYKIFTSQEFRRRNWAIVGDEVGILDKKQLFKMVSDPPVNSLIYVKSSGRKMGFLRCLRYASSKTMVALCGEDEGPVIVDRQRLRHVLSIAYEAYNTFKRKKTLLEGCSPREWEHHDLCMKIESMRGDPLWQILVRVL